MKSPKNFDTGGKRKIKKILFISYDNDSYIPFFPLNIDYLSEAVIKAKGQPVIWSQDIHHGPESALTELLDRHKIDIVGLGFCAGYYQYKKAKAISQAINESRRRKEFVYVLGGHGRAGDPEFFLDKL